MKPTQLQPPQNTQNLQATIKTPMSINPRVLDLVGGKEAWDKLCLSYREKIINGSGTNKPQLVPLFRAHGISERTYRQVIGIIGDKDSLHIALNRVTELELATMAAMVNNLMDELNSRIPKMENKELIELAKNLPTIMGNQAPTNTVNINQAFNINKHLADRGIEVIDIEE